MTNKKPPKKRKLSLSASITVIVAIIGCSGTVIAALIGLWGTNLQINKPMQATQTAQAESAKSTNPSVFSEVLDVTVHPMCGTPDVMPDYLDPFSDADKALSEFSDIVWRGDSLYSAPSRSPDFSNDQYIIDGSIAYFVTIASKSDNEWIKFANKIKVNVTSQKEDKGTVNTFAEESCGGGAFFRDFYLANDILETKYPSYTLDATYQDVDYFTLEPGESEVLTFGFQCGEPGLYQLQFEIPVEFQGETGSFVSSTSNFLCPSEGNYWTGTLPSEYAPDAGMIRLEGQYRWNGSQYVWEKP